MVDWKKLSETWNELPATLRQQLVDMMRQKQKENPEKFLAWLKEDTGRQIIWTNYAAPTPTPTVPTARVPTPAPPPAPKELTKEQIRKLEDIFKATFMRELGRIPRDVLSEFRVELDAVKTSTFEEASRVIEHLAMDIVQREKERVRVGAPIRVPVAVPTAAPPTPAPPPAVPPAKAEPPAVPLDVMPFPRRISSAETNAFYDAFVWQLYELGVGPEDYMDYFNAFRDAWYSNWFTILRSFDAMMDDIKAGKSPRYYPRPPIWKNMPRDAILHLLATKVYHSMDQLLAALNMHGVFLEAQEVREIVKTEWAKTPRDSWLTITPKEYLSETLGIPIEELPNGQ